MADGIYTRPGAGVGEINDSSPSSTTTYSGNKVEDELALKQNKASGTIENNIVIFDLNNEIKDSGKNLGEYAPQGHNHNSNNISLDTGNFGGVLDESVTNIQILADFIDDNIGFGAKIIVGIIDPTTEGNEGDMYVNTSTWDVFYKTSIWVLKGNIAGEDGADGINGTDGTDGTNGTDGINGTNGTDGDDGRAIVSILRTSGDGSAGTTDTYTITYSEAPLTSTFDVYNGADGEGSGDVTLDGEQTLTNKTLDDYTNHIHADAIHFRVKATEDIDKGQPLTITGWNVGEEAYEVELANQAVAPANGLASLDMPNGEFGMMEQTGTLTDIDTSSWSEGDILYVDGTGILTNTEPTTGYSQPIAFVVRSHANNGALQINADYPKQDAEDVRITDTNDYFNSTNAEGALEELGEIKQQTGYDLLNPDTMPDLAFDNGTRTLSVSVKSGQSEFIFWTNGKKHIKTTTQIVVIPDVAAFYYIYFDNSGTLQYVEWSATLDAVFYEYAITAGIRRNATQADGGLAEERHGIEMSSATHKMNHDTFGARYANGMNIEGLADGQPDYSQTTYGEFWDEDIEHTCAAATTHGWMYRLGTTGEWTLRTADNAIAMKDNVGDTYFSWNEWTGSTWQLTQGTSSTDYFITFFMAQPKYGGAQISKLIGQNAYSSRNNARNAIETEVTRMQIDGLPGPETVFLYAVIAKRDGELEDDGNGNEIYDLRNLKGGSSGSSGGSNYHADMLDLDTSGHPADIISYDNVTSGLSATEVQSAIDEVATSGGGGGDTVNFEILSADKTLVEGDDVIQMLDPNGADRIITFPVGILNQTFHIYNNVKSGDYSLDLRDSGGASWNIVNPESGGRYIYDGTEWRGIDSQSISEGDNGAIGIGRNANGYNLGVALGYNSVGYSSGVGIGYDAIGYSNGVAIGRNSDGYTSGVAIGMDTEAETYGTAIGYQAKGYTNGTAVGRGSDGYTNGAAVGINAQGHTRGCGMGDAANGKLNGVSIGYVSDGYDYGVAVGYFSQGQNKGLAIGHQVHTSLNSTSFSGGMGWDFKTTKDDHIAFCKGTGTTDTTSARIGFDFSETGKVSQEISQSSSAPTTVTDKLYNVGGELQWNGSSLGGGSGFDLLFPHGYKNGITPFGYTITDAINYTVPVGKTLYLTQLHSETDGGRLDIDATGIFQAIQSGSADAFLHPATPIVLPAGSVLSHSETTDMSIAGMLVNDNANITTIFDINNGYTVPAGKIYILMQIRNSGGPISVTIGGNSILLFEELNYDNTDMSMNTLHMPLLLGAGDSIDQFSPHCGFLIPEDFNI